MTKINLKKISAAAIMILYAVCAHGQSARDIMIKVERTASESSSSSVQKIKLSTCRYGKKGKKTVCAEKPRVKIIEAAGKDIGLRGKDSISLSAILKPAREKGMGMLTLDYDDPTKDTISRLYLPALGKVKKIVLGKNDDEEGGSYFGSEILLEDLEELEVDDYTHKLLKKTTYRKRPVWVVESLPTVKKLRKTRYGKSVIWVDAEKYIVLKVQMYNKRLKPCKRAVMQRVRKIDGVWTATKIIVQNLISKRMSSMTISSVRFNVLIPDEFLTERALIDVAYRERGLAKLRKYLK